MNEDRTRVLIVSDHPIMRAGLRLAIERQPDMHVAGEVTDGFTAVQSIRAIRPHIVLIDLPVIERDAALQSIWQVLPAIPIVALSELDVIVPAATYGLHHVRTVNKSASADLILESIRNSIRVATRE